MATRSCDPFAAVRNLVDTLKGLSKLGEWALSGADMRQKLMDCLSGETSGRSLNNLSSYDANDPIGLDSFRYRVEGIYTGVLFAGEGAAAQGSQLWRGSVPSLTASGLYLSARSADTFYGVVAGRARKLQQDTHQLRPVLATVMSLSQQMAVEISQTTPQEMDVYRDVRVMRDGVCPGLNDAAAEFRKISNGVAVTGDLEKSSCNALTLDQKLVEIRSALPAPHDARRGRILELNRKLVDAVTSAERVIARVESGRRMIPALDAQIETAMYIPIAEELLHAEVAAQLDAICENVKAYANTGRYAELYQALPAIHETLAIAIDVVRHGQKPRVNEVRAHPAAASFQGLAGTLLAMPQVDSLLNRMGSFQAELSRSWTGGSDKILGQIDQLQVAVNGIDSLSYQIGTVASSFQSAVDDLVDRACIDIVGSILNESAFYELERRLMEGLFGNIPSMLDQAGDVAGQAADCLRSFLGGAAGSVPAGPGRDALNRLSDATRSLSRVQEFAREASGKVTGFRNSMTKEIENFTATIERDARAAIGGKKLPIPDDEATMASSTWNSGSETPEKYADAFRAQTTLDPDGFMSTPSGVELPPGTSRDAEGYLRHDGVSPLPAGAVRDEQGYLRDVGWRASSTPAGTTPLAATVAQEEPVQSPKGLTPPSKEDGVDGDIRVDPNKPNVDWVRINGEWWAGPRDGGSYDPGHAKLLAAMKQRGNFGAK